jgi:hypothetical protein
MRRLTICLLMGVLGAGAAAAEVIDSKAARRALFSPGGAEVVINAAAGLAEADVRTLKVLVKTNRLKYYGAIAFSPDEGLLSEALQGAFDFHSTEAASVGALAACNAARKAGTAECMVAATITPKRWKPDRALQLSASATEVFKAFRKGRGPRALAISAQTGAYGVAKGEGAEALALTDCNAAAKIPDYEDCEIVIRD